MTHTPKHTDSKDENIIHNKKIVKGDTHPENLHISQIEDETSRDIASHETKKVIKKTKKRITPKEVDKLSAKPELGRIILTWEIKPDKKMAFIAINGKYFDEPDFRFLGRTQCDACSTIIPAEPLVSMKIKVQVVYLDGTISTGKVVETAALHKNVVMDEFEGRKMQIYLPDGYHEETDRIYPVIYMHDGQNLFSGRLAYLWEWQVDEVMDRLTAAGKIEKTIVVGIYNSSKRAEEYTPFADKSYGGGKAREFSEYVVDKILPYIEGKYRVSGKREDRAVMGSSFGGILSLWMGYQHPEVFSMVAAISPSMWIADGAMLYELNLRPKKDIKIWIDQGTGEYSDITRNAVTILIEKGYKYGEELVYYEVRGAEHNEIAWSKRIECPFIFFKGKPAQKIKKLKLNVQRVRHYAVGPYRYIINPVATFNNGMWYSLYETAKYSIEEGGKATIDKTGVLDFNGADFAVVRIQYQDLDESIVVKNPELAKKTKTARVVHREKSRKHKKVETKEVQKS